LQGTAGNWGGLCMNPIDRVSLHPPRSDTEIRRIISKESKCYLVEINWCRYFPMIYGKGSTSIRTLGIACGGINSNVNRMESTLKELEFYSLGLHSSSVVWNWCVLLFFRFTLIFCSALVVDLIKLWVSCVGTCLGYTHNHIPILFSTTRFRHSGFGVQIRIDASWLYIAEQI